MKRITIKEMATMMNIGEQQARIMVQRGLIPGAFCSGSKARKTYFITDTQVERVMKGVTGNEESLQCAL